MKISKSGQAHDRQIEKFKTFCKVSFYCYLTNFVIISWQEKQSIASSSLIFFELTQGMAMRMGPCRIHAD